MGCFHELVIIRLGGWVHSVTWTCEQTEIRYRYQDDLFG